VRERATSAAAVVQPVEAAKAPFGEAAAGTWTGSFRRSSKRCSKRARRQSYWPRRNETRGGFMSAIIPTAIDRDSKMVPRLKTSCAIN
jgi:hypothetical protein